MFAVISTLVAVQLEN